jgi:hypothetical protein
MKINQKSFSELVVIIKPTLFRAIGGLFFITGLILLCVLFTPSTITCQSKAENMAAQCVLTQNFAFVYPLKTELGDLETAKLHRWKNNKGQTQYQVRLIGTLQNATLGIFPNMSKYAPNSVIQAINRYIETDTKHYFPVPFLMNYLIALIGSAFTITGFLFITLMNAVTLRFDKGNNTLQIKRKNLFGTKIESYQLDNIEAIDIESSRTTKGQQTYRLVFKCHEGENVPLTKGYDSLLNSKLKLASTLSDFLEVPTQDKIDSAQTTNKNSKKLATVFFVVALIIVAGSLYFNFR